LQWSLFVLGFITVCVRSDNARLATDSVRVGSGPIGSGLVNRSACLTGSFGEGGDITFDARRVGDELDQRHQGARDVCFTRPPKADIHQHERHEASGMNGSNGWKQKSPDCHLPGLQLLTVSATGARRNMRAGEANGFRRPDPT
jgi:hypothetical protein